MWAKIFLIFGFVGLTVGNAFWIVKMFIDFGDKGCGGNLAIMCVTLLCGIAMYVLVLFRTRNDASVFTSSLVLAYCLFLQWSAFSSSP